MIRYLNQATKTATEDKKIPGTIEIGLFKSHNRLPLIMCDDSYGAFHISLPPKQSNESVLFELKGKNQSVFSKDTKLLNYFIEYFNLHWNYLEHLGFTGSLTNYASLINKVRNAQDVLKISDRQKELTEMAKYYFNTKQDDRNYEIAQNKLIINHHFGIGKVDNIDSLSQTEISIKLDELELSQIETLISFMGEVTQDDFVLDAGCGRGGTSIMIQKKFDCYVKGINISHYQIDFAKKVAKKINNPKLSFHVQDFLDMDSSKDLFDHVVLNEVSMYACYLNLLFSGVHKVLKEGGRLTLATWCLAGDYSSEVWANKINQHYHVSMHKLDDYLNSLSNFKRVRKYDYSDSAVDYFLLRDRWKMKSEIEQAFIDGFRTNKLKYVFITADK